MQSGSLRLSGIEIVKEPEDQYNENGTAPRYSEEECAQIVQVIQKDIEVRVRERQRLRRYERHLRDQDRKSQPLLEGVFNHKFCLLCYSRFFPFFVPKHQCHVCKKYFCGVCCKLHNKLRSYICKLCFEESDFMLMSCPWFYRIVGQKFTETGSSAAARKLAKETITNYSVLSSLNEFFKNNDLLASDVMMRVKGTQLTKLRHDIEVVCTQFRHRLRELPLEQLEILDLETTSEIFVKDSQIQLSEILKHFAQMLYVTFETQEFATPSARVSNPNEEVILTLKEEVENIVGYHIKMPTEDYESIFSYSVSGSSVSNDADVDFSASQPRLEDTLATVILQKTLEDLINYMSEQRQLENGEHLNQSIEVGGIDELLTDTELKRLEHAYKRKASSVISCNSQTPSTRVKRFTATSKLHFPQPSQAPNDLSYQSKYLSDCYVDPDFLSLSAVTDRSNEPMVYLAAAKKTQSVRGHSPTIGSPIATTPPQLKYIFDREIVPINQKLPVETTKKNLSKWEQNLVLASAGIGGFYFYASTLPGSVRSNGFSSTVSEFDFLKAYPDLEDGQQMENPVSSFQMEDGSNENSDNDEPKSLDQTVFPSLNTQIFTTPIEKNADKRTSHWNEWGRTPSIENGTPSFTQDADENGLDENSKSVGHSLNDITSDIKLNGLRKHHTFGYSQDHNSTKIPVPIPRKKSYQFLGE